MGDPTHTGEAARSPGEAPDDPRSYPRVEIAVRDSGSCSVLNSGDRMIYAHPEILKSEGGRICGQALSTAVPVAEEVARAAAEGRRMAPLEITCSREGCGAILVVQALPFGSEDTRTPTQPPASAPSPRRPGLQTKVGRLTPKDSDGPFLSRLESDVIEEIVELSQVVHCPEPTVFIREGQEGEALYVVASGEIEVVKEMEGGKEMRLALVGKGECLGEMSLLSGQPASATVRTLGKDTVILMLPKATLEALLSRRPTLHREFSRIIAQRLYSTNVRLETGMSKGISGNLSMIGVVDLIQTLHASRRTGTLTVRDGRGLKARVGLTKGQVSSALVSDIPGAEGFYGLLLWSDGTFSFEGGEPTLDSDPATAIKGDTMALLMEGLRRLDEGGR